MPLDNGGLIYYIVGMKIKKLKDFADIKTGFTFRDSVELRPELSGLAVIQVRNVVNNDFKDLAYTDKTDFKSSNILTKGDVLVTSRGQVRAAVYNERVKAVASNLLFIVRPNTEFVLPEYVALLINSDLVQKKLKRLQDYSTMAALSIKALGELEIPVLTKEKQKELVLFAGLATKQEKIFSELAELNKKLMNGVIKGALNG